MRRRRDDGGKKFERLQTFQWSSPEPTIWLDKVRACVCTALVSHAA
jgi:hypothetical protein